MSLKFVPVNNAAIPLHLIATDDVERHLSDMDAADAKWLETSGFKGAVGQCVLVSDADGSLKAAYVGLGSSDQTRARFTAASGAAKLPAGCYAIQTRLDGAAQEEQALGLLLSGYRFDRYKDQSDKAVTFVAPDGVDAAKVEAMAAGEALTRDLINTPASDMGPDELADAALTLAKTHDATIDVILGEDLLAQNFPMIHTVGRASTRHRGSLICVGALGVQS